MSTKPLKTAEEPHAFAYDPAGAAELLRMDVANRPKSFMDAKRSATCQLLGDLIVLFEAYGYQTGRRADREWGHVWTMTFFKESLYMAVGKDGRAHAWLQPHQGDRKLCGLDVSLTFDPAEERWLGPRRVGGDGQRVDALEELTRGILVVLRHQVRQ